PLIRAEGLVFHGDQLRLHDVSAFNVPARRKAGRVEDYWPLGVGDDAVMMADHQPARGLADVDAVVTVSGMAHDPFIFLIKSVHRWPSERYSCPQLVRVYGQLNVLPRSSRSTLLVCPDGVPGCESEVGVPSGMLTALQAVWRDVALRKIGHRIVAGFEEQEHVLAIGDPGPAEMYAHAPPQRLG